MGEQIKNMLIGIFILASCAILVGIIMFLKPSVGDMKKTLYVRFSNINKIDVGTRVTYAGKPVGEVVAIQEISDPRHQPIDSLKRFYFYQLTLKVDSSVVVYNTDQIALQTSGLLGEKSVAIIPIEPPKGITPKVVTNQPIYASSVDPIENAFVELSGLADQMKDSFSEITCWFKQNEKNLSSAVKNFSGAMRQIDKAVGDVNKFQIIHEIKDTIHNLSCTISHVQSILTNMDQDGVFTNFALTMKNVQKASRSIELVSQDLADGKGTLGKLLKTDDLYLRFTAVMSKIDTLMNDINSYGLLFHLNKGWQRTHSKRVNLMDSLSSPTSFKDYFETEVDQINNSMSRISMLIEKAAKTPEKDKILQSDIFKSDFAELLRKTDELSENLRLYNEQLMEASK